LVVFGADARHVTHPVPRHARMQGSPSSATVINISWWSWAGSWRFARGVTALGDWFAFRPCAPVAGGTTVPAWVGWRERSLHSSHDL
jgi:hypothetical protein